MEALMSECKGDLSLELIDRSLVTVREEEQLRHWLDECFYRRELQTLSQYFALTLKQKKTEQEQEDLQEMRNIIVLQLQRSDKVAYYPQSSVLKDLSDNVLYLEEEEVRRGRLEQHEVILVSHLEELIKGATMEKFFFQVQLQCSLQRYELQGQLSPQEMERVKQCSKKLVRGVMSMASVEASVPDEVKEVWHGIDVIEESSMQTGGQIVRVLSEVMRKSFFV